MTKRPNVPKFQVPRLINTSPFYRPKFEFKSSTMGSICLRVSRLQRDWPAFQIQSQAEVFAKGFIAFARLWLEAHGYGPVKIQIVDGYVPAGSYDWQDSQALLRQKIMSDYINPTNSGSMSNWAGIKQEQSEAQRRGYMIDFGVKSE